MAYETHVLYDRFFSAKGLDEEKSIKWNCHRELEDDTHLRIKKDQADYERIFQLPIVPKMSVPGDKITDLVVELEVGLEYTGTAVRKDPLSWTVSNDDHAIGIQLRDLTEYRTLGPYVGIEGTPGKRVLEYPANVEKKPQTSTGPGTSSSPSNPWRGWLTAALPSTMATSSLQSLTTKTL